MSEINNQNELTQFKEYAVLHPQLAKVDTHLMRAIREPADLLMYSFMDLVVLVKRP